MRITEFELTEDHIKLLQHAYVRWDAGETGAPAIDPKRLYGNSHVPSDVTELLGWDVKFECDTAAEEDAREAAYDRAMTLHRETEVALQIVLVCGPTPGRYRLADRYDRRSWVRA